MGRHHHDVSKKPRYGGCLIQNAFCSNENFRSIAYDKRAAKLLSAGALACSRVLVMMTSEESAGMNEERSASGPYLPAGTKVRYDGLEEGSPEHGIVVHCWLDTEINAHDCYVAFFGKRQPNGKPAEKPYILRYASASLTVMDNAAD